MLYRLLRVIVMRLCNYLSYCVYVLINTYYINSSVI